MDGITIYVTDNGHQIIYEPVILFQLSECKTGRFRHMTVLHNGCGVCR